MPVKLKLAELEELARRAGYESYPAMLHELYVVQGHGLQEIARRCNVNVFRTRRHLVRFNIPIRGRGGRHSVKVEMTPALVQEVIQNGLPATSVRLGVTQPTLQKALDAYKPPDAE